MAGRSLFALMLGLWLGTAACTTSSDTASGSTTVSPSATGTNSSLDVPAEIAGDWVLDDESREQLNLATDEAVSLSNRSFGHEVAPFGIEVSLGCRPYGGGTSLEAPLLVTDVTTVSHACSDTSEDGWRVSFEVLEALPRAVVDADGLLRVQVFQGELVFSRS